MRAWLLILLTLISLPAFSASYTKIANNGSELPGSALLGSGATDWACTRDNATGLVWEVKTTDGGLRERNKTYTNYDDATQAQKSTGSGFVNPAQAEIDAATNSIGFANAVNATALCGAVGWRMPSRDELLGIVDTANTPTINPSYFPNTPSSNFWSGSPVAGDPDLAWVVYFYYGFGYWYDRSNTSQVRLVRGGQSFGTFALTVSTTGTGSGTLAGNGINCTRTAGTSSGTCSTSLASGTPVILTATSVIGSTFTGWGGACSGTASTCSLTMDAAKSVTAAFAAFAALTPQTLAFGAAPTLAVGGTGTVSATASSGLPVTFSSLSPPICTVSGSTVSGIAAGTCTVAANQAGNSTYAVAPQATQSFSSTMRSVAQTLTFGAAPALAVGGTGTVSATASSGLPVTFSSLSPSICNVSGNTVSAIAAGLCIVAANQAGNGSFSPAPQATQNLSSTVTFPNKAIELYHSTLKHYFITRDPVEAAGLDRGGWTRTGGSFNVWPLPVGSSQPVCRFYGSFSPGPNSHFFTVDTGECAGLRELQASIPETQKKWHYESTAFYINPPLNKTCTGGDTPVYRYYNNGSAHGEDSNHRLTTDASASLRASMEAAGWIPEGVVMCGVVKPATAAFTVDMGALFKGRNIVFNDTSTGSPTAWHWTFGDGSTSSSRNPSHTYTTVGHFLVTLTITHSTGGDYVTQTLNVAEDNSGGGGAGG
jgi:hypothetical protein